jgi:ectoine hydroxylase-related dioxygenase (phytanoyl-CoA dioxygenase family)
MTFEAAGYAVLPSLISREDLSTLQQEVDRLLSASSSRGGARNVLGKSALLQDLATAGPPAQAAAAILGSGAQPTKLTVFDKTPDANWKVPWHQDLTIAVAERREVPGFGPWTVKDGVLHVQPPTSVLENVLAIRLHLDDTPADNGALRVLPGSHRFGRLSPSQIAEIRQRTPKETCEVPAGGAMLMSPLLLHASSASDSPSRRRVLHFEYSAAPLPGGLRWN